MKPNFGKMKLVTKEYLTEENFHFENGILEEAGISEVNGMAVFNAVVKLNAGGCSIGGYTCGTFTPSSKDINSCRFGSESILWLMAVAGVDKSSKLGGQYVRVAFDKNDQAVFIGHIFKDIWFNPEILIKDINEEERWEKESKG